MARVARDFRLETRGARAKLKPRKEPYWRSNVPGLFLRYYKIAGNSGTWIARKREGIGYRSQRIGTADDFGDADGDVLLSYKQAFEHAQKIEIEKRQPPRHDSDGLTLNDVFDA